MTLATTVTCLGGIPAPDLIATALNSLLAPMANDDLVIADGPQLRAADYQTHIAELVQSRPQFSAQGKRKSELTMQWMDVIGVGLSRTGFVSTYLDTDAASSDELVQAMAATASTLRAPLATLDDFAGGIRPRLEQHRDVYQADKTGADRIFGLLRGFTGIAWRTVLGPASVAFFGADTLSTLPASLGQQIDDGFWLLTPCVSPDEWTPDRYCDGERAIIDALGSDRFFDPETDNLPTVLPELPEVADIAVTARSRDEAGEWVWHSLNGYPS